MQQLDALRARIGADVRAAVGSDEDGREVGGEGFVEPGRVDPEFRGRLRAVARRVLKLLENGVQDAVRGVAFDVREGLAFVWGEGET